MNMSRVSAEATAAVKHSQSPSSASISSWFMGRYSGFKLTLGVGMACVQRNTILVSDSRVEIALHLVDILGYQVQAKLSIGEQVVKQTCEMFSRLTQGVSGGPAAYRDCSHLRTTE